MRVTLYMIKFIYEYVIAWHLKICENMQIKDIFTLVPKAQSWSFM